MLDLFAAEEKYIRPHSVEKIGTGLSVELPPNYFGQIFSRSSFATTVDISVPTGTIDNQYRGEVFVVLRNNSIRGFFVKTGMRIAQLAIFKTENVCFKEVQKLTETERGDAGFGSSGC